MRSVVFALALLGGRLALADIAPPPPSPVSAPADAGAADAGAELPDAGAIATVVPAPAPPAVHPEGIERAAPTGVIEGGWGYVYACYVVTIGGSLAYALSLFLRRPRGGQGRPS
jgi:hypothetical protein